jgi:hypothetical protein
MHIAAVAGVLVSLLPIAFIGYVNVGGIRKALRDRRAKATEPLCSIDADCPEGYICRGGRCIPEAQ